MPLTACKPHPRTAAAVTVLGLHLVLLAGVLRLGVWPERTPQSSHPPLAVQLIWQRLAMATPAPDQRPPPEARRLRATPRAALPLPVGPASPAPSETTNPALQAITPPGETPPQTSAAAAAPPLNLALPRSASAAWRQRPQALDDPRSSTPKLTMEQKLVMAMGGEGQWVEEVIDADHRRLRRGNMCVYLQRSAAAQLDPFHPASRNSPWQASQPTRC
ncbi:MAG: hypothetical protein JNK55_06970 [Rubrivivax sp.]|nr:hypothetical protein [Rubrivivax sp.]